ncbi:MAG: hypothetical protein ABF381_02320 [Akkermansiaceae bacterium]|jgi:mannan endo-1,4-beta-mannosidase
MYERVLNSEKRFRAINQLADKKGKVAALTETRVDKVPNADWWAKYLLKALKHDK